MAQETILKVSLKEYKQGIDELRASLLGLDKDSEEYGKIVQEIAERQDNLNDAMNAGKQAVNAVDGSYNALAQTLSNLKKEWKNMQMGTPEWEAMAVRINDINNQLKDADASVGVFSRNVGDYANAFEEAFKSATKGLGTLPGTIGQIGSMTKELTPLIKKAATTATAGLNGVKKAIMSTGIGALVVAVGLLIANFDKLQNMFRKSDDAANKLDEDVKKMNETFKAENEALDIQIKYMEAQGASVEDVNKKKLELIETQKALTKSTIEETKAKIAELEAHSAFRRWITGENKDIEKYKEILADLEAQEKEQAKEITNINTTIATDKIKEARKAAEEEKKQLDEVLKKVKDNSKSEIQALTDKYNEEYALLKKHGKDTAALTEQYEKQKSEIRKKALDSAFSEFGQFVPEAQIKHDFALASEEVEKFQQVVNRKFPPEGIENTLEVTREMINEAKRLGLTTLGVADNVKKGSKEYNDALDEFLIKYNTAYYKYKSLAKDLVTAWYEPTEEWKEYMDELWNDERYSYYYKKLMTDTQTLFNFLLLDVEDFKKALSEIEAGTLDYVGEGFESLEEAKHWYETLLPIMEKYKEKFGKDIEGIIKDSAEYENVLINLENVQKNIMNDTAIIAAELRKTDFLAFLPKINEYINNSFNTSRLYDLYQAQLDAAIWYRDNLEIIEGETEAEHENRVRKAEQNILNIKREYAKKQVEIAQGIGNGLTSIWSSINDIYEGKIDEQNEADRDNFENLKKSKIALGWVETIQGALAAFMGYQEYPQPYGAILGGIAAAATFAAGVAQIEAIENTQFGASKNGSVSPPNAAINATPRMADYQPDTIQNLTGASETQNLANALQQTPIYVSVTDINNAQVKVTDRNNESSF